MTWQTVDTSASGSTERLKIEQGWLYRSAWRINMGIGTDMLSGSDITFVPAVHAAPYRASQAAVIAPGTTAAATQQFGQTQAGMQAQLRAQQEMAHAAGTQVPGTAAQSANMPPTPGGPPSRPAPTPPSTAPGASYDHAPAVREDDKAGPVPSASGATGPAAV